MDGHGHGTHVSGIVAGKSFGVAKKATIIAVKILDDTGSGDDFGVVLGIEYVIWRRKKRARPSVINMSIGGPVAKVLNDAVVRAYKAGVYTVVSAGNEWMDACYSSPASAKLAITVGASDFNDQRSWFSNYGKCVDVFAPGSRIVSVVPPGLFKGPTEVWDGTSMAAPHVAGALAVIMAQKPGLYADIQNGIVDFLNIATRNQIFDVRMTVNRVLYLNLNNVPMKGELPAPVFSNVSMSAIENGGEGVTVTESGTGSTVPIVASVGLVGLLVIAAAIFSIVKRKKNVKEKEYLVDAIPELSSSDQIVDLQSSRV